MSFSILVVDDEPDVADLFRQRFRLEARQGYGSPAIPSSHWTGGSEDVCFGVREGPRPYASSRH